jgi:hypothetical protein
MILGARLLKPSINQLTIGQLFGPMLHIFSTWRELHRLLCNLDDALLQLKNEL